jgi:hypothetical protein
MQIDLEFSTLAQRTRALRGHHDDAIRSAMSTD